MAEESQRFQKVMDKLFRTPKSKPPPSPSSASRSKGQSSRGTKQLKTTPVSKTDQTLRHNLIEDSDIKRSLVPLGLEAPICRPWDRGDLMRRLSMFKSMTWFAKPKVVSPVNCARRGWVNVDIDTISCEACGARLLFSTPSSWTQQQVEKAAAVFSLKLDSGHKLLCPWIDNVCDETLALFPPTPASTLVEGYKERSSALVRLSALPVISSAAIDHMWSSKLHWLLEKYFHPLSALGGPVVLVDSSRNGLHKDAASRDLYNQAQKLISLCGWELRVLPYTVECKDHSKSATGETELGASSSEIIKRREHQIVVSSSENNGDVSKSKDENAAPFECQNDPSSVVLDCRFCGASIGLWAFLTVQRPLELIRLVETAEVSFQPDSVNNGGEFGKRHPAGALMMEMPSGLNMTIAGGLPPTKQNLRATVSLPIISRHLRTGLCSTSNMEKLKRKRTEDGVPTEIDGVSKDENSNVEKDGRFLSSDPLEETSKETERSTAQDMGEANVLQDAEDTVVHGETDDHTTQVREVVADAIVCSKDEKDNEKSLEHIEANLSNDSEHTSMIVDAPCADACVKEAGEGDRVLDNDNRVLQLTNQTVGGVGNMMQTSVNNVIIAENPPERDSKFDKGIIMHFDPIKQHRHFCPWITSADESHLPGWQVTLSALFQEESPDTSLKEQGLNSSIIEVDDPIMSVRQLFMSPAEKKRKSFHG
ncbi:hypothetical protein H6P81_010036 [Aristolochia fimbriata]|uniref:C3HC-type domain-containing protein n=1 Tax=Aristolochia fimbriata TaxID=158543 RepID=A0AAV7EQG2_ARIFI|nr:hypothetical protein H6P81_010036 [Aristolochia fimbriata]